MSQSTPAAPHILHVFPSFTTGGAQARTVALINGLGKQFRHTVLALDDHWESWEKLDATQNVQRCPPPKTTNPVKRPLLLREILVRLSPDLLITYNWGATEALTAAACGLRMPVLHTEDGFGTDESQRLKWRRVLARRVLLRRAFAIVVPSDTLRRIAIEQYRIPEKKVRFIANGVDLDHFRPLDQSDKAPPGAEGLYFGTVGKLRPEKALDGLLRAFAEIGIPGAKLMIAGDGECRGQLESLARGLGLKDRVCFTGAVSDPAPYLQKLDVFVMSSHTEQMPISLLEAMACGLPALCTGVGDCALLLGSTQFPAIVPPGQQKRYTEALRTFADSADLRAQLGRQNRLRCERNYSFSKMLESYRALYLEALHRK